MLVLLLLLRLLACFLCLRTVFIAVFTPEGIAVHGCTFVTKGVAGAQRATSSSSSCCCCCHWLSLVTRALHTRLCLSWLSLVTRALHTWLCCIACLSLVTQT